MPTTTSVLEGARSPSGPDPASVWWVFGLLGLVSLIAGAILVAKPSHSLATLAVVFGIFLLLDGIVELVSSFRRDEGGRALTAIIGVLGIVVGLILIRHPTHAVNAIGLLIGIWLVAAGAIGLVYAVVERNLFRLAIAALEIIIGIVVVGDPHIGYATLAILVGIWLILNGLGMIGAGFLLRGARGSGTPDTVP
jgi:uncharacterized membrane protein HdeD (DUF308 family)